MHLFILQYSTYLSILHCFPCLYWIIRPKIWKYHIIRRYQLFKIKYFLLFKFIKAFDKAHENHSFFISECVILENIGKDPEPITGTLDNRLGE